jgi:hypothetical protein
MSRRRAHRSTVLRDEFRKNPTAALRRAETHGSVVIREKNGRVHSVISVPRDDRPIVK